MLNPITGRRYLINIGVMKRGATATYQPAEKSVYQPWKKVNGMPDPFKLALISNMMKPELKNARMNSET